MAFPIIPARQILSYSFKPKPAEKIIMNRVSFPTRILETAILFL